MSTLEVDKLTPQSGTSLTLGDSGDTFTVPTGASLVATDELKTNKISPSSGTAFTFGDSGDTFTIPAGATIANSGTATGFGDNDAVLIASATGGGATTQQFDGCFSATYKFYMILANITMSSDAHVYCRFQDSSNNQLSGGVYYYQGTAATNASGSISVAGSGNFGGSAFGPNQTIQASSSRFGAYRIFIYDPFTSTTKPNYSLSYTCQSAASELRTVEVQGVYDTAVTAAGFRFISSTSGTIGSASTFKVYGFK